MREGGREGRGVSLTLWEVLEDSGDTALGEQENLAVSLGPHCATVGDIMNQVDLGREGGVKFLWFLWLRGKHELFTHETVPHTCSTGMWFSILQL